LEGEEEDYKMNQILVGIKDLFRGYIVKVWKGTSWEKQLCRAK